METSEQQTAEQQAAAASNLVELQGYFQDNSPKIEAALAEAVCAAIAEKHSDPITLIAELLRQQRTDPPASATNHQGAVAQAIEIYNAAPKEEEEKGHPWRATQWLDSLGLTSVIANTLLRPLQEKAAGHGAELPFVHAIGQFKEWQGVHAILASHDVLEMMSQVRVTQRSLG